MFDYFFYRVSNFVQKSKLEKKHPEASGGAVVPLFQLLNIVTILYFLFNISITVELNLYIGIPLYIITWIFFYNRKKLRTHKKRWDNEDTKKRYSKGMLLIVYMMVTLLMWGIAISKQ